MTHILLLETANPALLVDTIIDEEVHRLISKDASIIGHQGPGQDPDHRSDDHHHRHQGTMMTSTTVEAELGTVLVYNSSYYFIVVKNKKLWFAYFHVY
jgi:hypothetical protein